MPPIPKLNSVRLSVRGLCYIGPFCTPRTAKFDPPKQRPNKLSVRADLTPSASQYRPQRVSEHSRGLETTLAVSLIVARSSQLESVKGALDRFMHMRGLKWSKFPLCSSCFSLAASDNAVG